MLPSRAAVQVACEKERSSDATSNNGERLRLLSLSDHDGSPPGAGDDEVLARPQNARQIEMAVNSLPKRCQSTVQDRAKPSQHGCLGVEDELGERS